MTAVQTRALAVLHDRNLRFRPLLGRRARALLQETEYGPPRAGIRYQAHVAPRERNAVPAVHGAQIPRCVCIEKVPMPVRRHRSHSPHQQRRSHAQLAARVDAMSFTYQETSQWNSRAEQCTREETALEI